MATEISYSDGSGSRHALWLSEGMAPPASVVLADDRTTADAALQRVRRGEHLLYSGDYQNARQLLSAMGRRLAKRRRSPSTLANAFREERQHTRLERDLLSRLLVPVAPDLSIPLRRAPDLRQAILEAWGSEPEDVVLVPLRELLGIVGAHQWRVKGVMVTALGGRVYPHYGVFAPVREEYVELVAAELSLRPGAGRRAFDIGTGTGVLALLLAKNGWQVVATDDEPRAVSCARENVSRFGFEDQIEVLQADLFPPGRADLIIMNPPWMPEEPLSPLDRAVYDPGGQVLSRFLSGLRARLEPGGEGWLVLSDLPQLLGLRTPRFLSESFTSAGLRLARSRSTRSTHPRTRDAGDPLHAARAQETTSLHCLTALDSAPVVTVGGVL